MGLHPGVHPWQWCGPVTNVSRVQDVAVAERQDHWREVVRHAVMPMEVPNAPGSAPPSSIS